MCLHQLWDITVECCILEAQQTRFVYCSFYFTFDHNCNLGERNRSDEAIMKGDEPMLEVERPRVEPHQFCVQLKRREEVKRAAVADDGGVLEDGDPVAVAHVARQTLRTEDGMVMCHCGLTVHVRTVVIFLNTHFWNLDNTSSDYFVSLDGIDQRL